jgi:phosphoribosylanthranilate isomerase
VKIVNLRLKICGITQVAQGQAIAALGAHALGFVCVPASPRFVTPEQIQSIAELLPSSLQRIGVFANSSLEQIQEFLAIAPLTGIQLHGDESLRFCDQLKQRWPDLELIKALRVRSSDTLDLAHHYAQGVDTLLLDAYDPSQLGGTGKTINWSILQNFQPLVPWLLAGGLTPENVRVALEQVHPNGIDLSSGVERSPGDKDLSRVAELFSRLSIPSC